MGHGSKRRECILRVRERKRSGGEEEEEEMEAEEAGIGEKEDKKEEIPLPGRKRQGITKFEGSLSYVMSSK